MKTRKKVFRKKADPALTEDDYRIYTDAPSLRRMKLQWYILPVIFLVLSFYTFARQLTSFGVPELLLLLGFLTVDALILFQILAMRRSRTGRRMKIRVDPLIPMLAPADAGGYFRSAALTVKTKDGTATCWYYPTDFTDQGHDTGFTVNTRAKWRLFDKTHRPGTAQEAIDLMYAVVYPDGLQ